MTYFGTDGIRGIPNQELTIDLMVRIGQALAIFKSPTICIATDTRQSKDMLVAGIVGGAMSKGLHVIYLGILPTPALIYYAQVHQITGIMITASHNPYGDNGIKILNRGRKLSLEEEGMLEIEIEKKQELDLTIGQIELCDGEKVYYEHIKSIFNKSNLKIAIDCANGATYHLAPMIFKQLASEVIVVAATPDGKNINKDCGSTHLELLQQTVLNHHCDLGFAFDGDGDRVLCVDSTGRIITGDELIYVFACYLKSKNRLYQNKVVLSKMSNLGILSALEQQEIEVVLTEVGDKYISMVLNKQDLSLGGENSGHIIIPHLFSSGDGILAACFLLEVLTTTKITLEQWLSNVLLCPEKTINIKANHKEQVITDKRLKDTISNIKETTIPNGKIIVRVSGTEDVIRLTVMDYQKEQVKQAIACISEKIREIDYE